jgi:hypothetical protein
MAALDASFVPGADDDRQVIRCIYCQRQQQVSFRALSVTCKFCHRAMRVEALTISDFHARRAIEICGPFVVEKTGNVSSDRILCQSLVVRGRVKANILSRGPVLVGPDAQVKGDITAPTLAVGDGAKLDGNYRIGAATETAR